MHKTTGLAAGVVAALILTGCVQQPRHVVPTSAPAAKPVFKSNAEALAAAKKAYAGYLKASDAVGRAGGLNSASMKMWVTAKWWKYEAKSYSSFAESSQHLSGSSSFSGFALQQLEQSVDGDVSLSAYVCDDVAGIRVLDKAGHDVTPAKRPEVVALEVDFVNASRGSSNLLVSRSDSWSGTDFC